MKYYISELNGIKRGSKKASYDKKTVYSILDETKICHIAFLHQGKALVQPINFGRNGDKLYIHGSTKNRMTNALLESKSVSLNVMILDAMLLTRSAFNHSVHYRSATIFGSVRELTNNEEKIKGLKSIVNHFVPNRWKNCRKPNEKELKATRVLEITIETASAKISNKPPTDKDFDLDFWAGTIPVKTVFSAPIPTKSLEKSNIPKHILDFCEQNND